MAAGPGRKKQAEREFYYRKLGGNFPQIPIVSLARRYMIGYLGANLSNPKTPFEQLEVMWAKQYIITAGGTPSPTNKMSSLWRQLVVTIGQTPHSNQNDNAYIFYVNAP